MDELSMSCFIVYYIYLYTYIPSQSNTILLIFYHFISFCFVLFIYIIGLYIPLSHLFQERRLSNRRVAQLFEQQLQVRVERENLARHRGLSGKILFGAVNNITFVVRKV